GKTLYGSGIFTSPNHPNYYDSNTYCSTVLRTSHDQQIFLEFTFLEIENCCSCDYIEVYDGPSTNSRYLGKVCNNSLSTFSSSSNYMTVLFRTDGSVVGRGFTAQFSSSVSPRSVNCSSYGMEIVIERSYLNSIGYNASSLYLDDNTCRPHITSRQVIFRYSLNSCGNVRKFHNGKAMYSNNVRAYNSSISGEVTRLSHFKLNVACLMEQESLSQIMYVVKIWLNQCSLNTATQYDANASLLHHQVTEFPYMVSLNQYLNTEVRLDRAESDFVLFLDTCVASPSPDDFSYRPYYLVRNGCNMDSTFQVWSTSSYYVRFRFKAFQFLRASESVYLQCKVVICYTNDSNSRCRKGCMRRKKRSLSPGDKSHTVVLGPIKLKGEKQSYLLAQILLEVLHKVQRVRLFLAH
uniref:CUB and zona pellucida-like domains 1, tandem duplicate 1 n=1 Tax=Cynoglossus semilaevis TaxID=244447 RepID=A0A3P8URK3_CYNSE